MVFNFFVLIQLNAMTWTGTEIMMEEDLVQTAVKAYAEETVIHQETRILFVNNLWLILEDLGEIFQHKVAKEGQ